MNFYTKLISKVDPLTNLPVFKSIQIQLACQACIDAEKAHECVHLQHLIPRWQVTCRAREIKTVYCRGRRSVKRNAEKLCVRTVMCLILPKFHHRLY
tara:strand:+ start:183 stop:473 length:291 start_codon:yes stop_codon:yes gene_type:complete